MCKLNVTLIIEKRVIYVEPKTYLEEYDTIEVESRNGMYPSCVNGELRDVWLERQEIILRYLMIFYERDMVPLHMLFY